MARMGVNVSVTCMYVCMYVCAMHARDIFLRTVLAREVEKVCRVAAHHAVVDDGKI